MLTWPELNDWLALYEIDPWGEQRADLRSAVNALQSNGSQAIDSVLFPYMSTSDNDEISVEDEADLIATLNEMNNVPAGTAKPETDRIG